MRVVEALSLIIGLCTLHLASAVNVISESEIRHLLNQLSPGSSLELTIVPPTIELTLGELEVTSGAVTLIGDGGGAGWVLGL